MKFNITKNEEFVITDNKGSKSVTTYQSIDDVVENESPYVANFFAYMQKKNMDEFNI